MENITLPLGIDSYLESISDNKPISLDDLEELILKVRTYSDIEKEIVKIIVREFFQEIRNSLLKKEEVNFQGLGKIKINPKNLNLYFYPSEKLIQELNA